MLKKMCALLVICSTMLVSSIVSANEVTYSAVNKKITVSGNNVATTLAVVVMPYKYTVEELSVDVINSTPNILYMPISAGGSYHEVISLAGDMTLPGKYRVSENSQNKSVDSVYFILPENVCNNINATSEYSEFKTLFNNLTEMVIPEINNNVKTVLVDKMYNEIEKNGYTYQSFHDNFALYEGVLNCKYGVIGFKTFMDEYATYVSGDNKAEYALLSEIQKTAANNCIAGIDVAGKDADDIITETILVAKLRGALNFTELKQYATEYFTENGNMPLNYKKLSEYYQNNVFVSLFDNRETIESGDDLINRVEKISANQKIVSTTPSGGGGGGGNSERSPIKGAPIGNTNTPQKTELFNDISDHWAENNITEMYKMGIVSGFDDGSFRPDKNVTRAEFVKMLVSTMNYKTDGKCSFVDVPENAWYYEYISSAVSMGVVSGISATKFGPDMPIIRQDSSVMVYRAIDKIFEGSTNIIYADYNEISDYATEAVTQLSAAEILIGTDGYFRPKDSITRAEAATLLLRVKKLVEGGRN